MRAGVIASSLRITPPLLTMTDTGQSESTATTRTFIAPIGEPYADRSVILAFAYRLNFKIEGRVPTVTVNGLDASVDVHLSSPIDRMVAAIARAHVPTGETAEVDIAWGRSATAKLGWSVFHAPSPTLAATGTSTGSGSPATLTTPAGATTLAVSIAEATITNSTATWTGADELADEWISGGTSFSTALATAAGTIHPAATWVSPTSDVVTVVAAYL